MVLENNNMKKTGSENRAEMEGMRICAGIVSWCPDSGQLRQTASHIVSQVEGVLICDNGTPGLDQVLASELEGWRVTESRDVFRQGGSDFLILRNETNRGIASGLNQLCACAEELGYDWILTLDQDTQCPENMISALSAYTAPDVGIVAAGVLYEGAESIHPQRKGIREAGWVITGGSLTSIQAWRAVGGFDEPMFIDSVDQDFCIRLKQAGYRILENNDCLIHQPLGRMKLKKFFGRTVQVTHHSPKRKYYMARNAVYLDRKYGKNKAGAFNRKLLLKTLIYEKDRIHKIPSILRGIRDGKKLPLPENEKSRSGETEQIRGTGRNGAE